MRLEIRRTSVRDDDVSPCEEAIRENCTLIDERVVDDPKKIPANNGTDGGWYDGGTNHRVENGRIRRDFPDHRWVVEIKDLDELMAFSIKYGELIIGESWNTKNLSLEIYDDYRE